MLQDTHLSAFGKLIGQLASNRYPSWLSWVLKLTMASPLRHLKPAIVLDCLEDFGDFHLIVHSIIVNIQAIGSISASNWRIFKRRGHGGVREDAL